MDLNHMDLNQSKKFILLQIITGIGFNKLMKINMIIELKHYRNELKQLVIQLIIIFYIDSNNE